ncbi:MAG: hypothetical protein DMF76_18320 [Acidobacteria bacterium]|nr:MAG: hypothetical protein DMF76_18320 [Acidobacteriota bacterium]
MLPSSSFCYSPTRLTKIVEQIKELRHQVREFASAIERLAYEVRRIDEKVDYYARNEAQQRENLNLRVENALLKSGRQLPPEEPNEDATD